ncbi:MAG: dolichol-phosphate mannosyltransferase [Saprospiraceae bacterium]|jgi:dolichol-phosphate mannosyltransferase
MAETLVIIPTYNEIDNIKDIIHAVFSLEEPFHVLIVDDGSPDGTADVVKTLMQNNSDRLFIEERKGKLGLGTAYIHGFNWALPKGYEYIFEMDADFSHNPKDLLLLLKACKEDGADLAIGSRYVTGVNVVNWPMSRVLMSYFASVYVRWITRMPVRDATAGFKCYTRKVLETIDLNKVKFVGYAFQIEMKFTAWKFGFKITEVPIIFTERQKGNSKMHSGIFKEAVLGVLQMKISSWFRTFKA